MKLLAMLIVLAMLTPGTLMAGDDGPTVFANSKCAKCHTVQTANIETESKKDPSEIKDLSDVGNSWEKKALWDYLRKETEKDGEFHKVKYRGEKEDFETLVAWLLTLKND